MHARMLRLVLAAIALSAVGIGFMYAREDERERENQSERASESKRASSSAPASSEAARAVDVAVHGGPLQGATADPAGPLAPDAVARLIADTNSGDAATRAAAIVALVDAPKAAAVPALRRIVEGGEPSVDRPLALRSLRDLALHQGDADGAIRNVARETIYHADDDALVEYAQLALEIIEESEMARTND